MSEENKAATIWYRTGNWSNNIQPVNVVKETSAKIWHTEYNGNPTAANKRGAWCNYWPTKREAIAHLRSRSIALINNAKEDIKRGENSIAELDKMEAAESACA